MGALVLPARRVLVAAVAGLTVVATGTWVGHRNPADTSAAAAPAVVATAAPAPNTPWPAVGALFGGTATDPGAHFCSAAVADSAAGNVIVTAAHCVADGNGEPARTGMTFAPAYGGTAPFGYWTVTAAAVDPAWLSGGDPDDDVAFLIVEQPGSPPIQQVTGGYRVDFGDPAADVPVTAVGYNSDSDDATTVSGTATPWSATQWQLAAPGLSDGTSGGPLLGGPDATEILGVIGGYQQGGDTADVSYAAALGATLRTLYEQSGGTD